MNIMQTHDIAYEVIRSRRTTADIVVERDGRITVRVPEDMTQEGVEAVLHSRRLWIYKALAEWRDLNAARVLREFRNGEGFLYLGRFYRLALVEDQAEPLLLKEGRFYLNRRILTEDSVEAARLAFRRFYIEKGRQRLKERVAYYAPKAGVEPGRVTVRSLGHRWASCSPRGDLTFHWKCMMAPQTVIDYVVVHELCHFHHRDHTDAFWNEVDKVLPDYRERKEWLRRNGAGLDL